MITDPHQLLLHELAETKRRVATSDRMGTVSEVKQGGGEQKIRVEYGVDHEGKPVVGPWINTTDHRGATREQQQFKKGQNVRISGVDGDYRQATVTPAAEGDSFPQPDSAADHGYGDSFQAGKLHTGKWMPEDDDDKQGGGQGGQGGQGGSSGGGGQGGQEKNHRHEVWIAKEDNKPPAHQGKSRSVETDGGEGAAPQQKQQEQQQGQQKKKKEPEAAVMVSVDEKNGYTARVGKGEEAVRIAAHEKGVKSRAGKDNFFASEKDKDSWFFAKINNNVKAKDGQNFVNKPWIIKDPEPEKIPNDDKLGNKSGGK